MVDYLPRSAWDARPPDGTTRLVASEVDGTAIHWPGMASPLGRDRVAGALRGWQNYHMDVKGWSDIAYQVAVDQWGRAWTLRGFTTRSAANGDTDVNRRFGAILLILAPGEEPTYAMKATVRGVVAEFRATYPDGTRIEPHSAVRPAGTDCPGDQARAAISRGEFTPSAAQTGDDDMTPEQATSMIQLLTQMNDRIGDLVNRQTPELRYNTALTAGRVGHLVNNQLPELNESVNAIEEDAEAIAADFTGPDPEPS